MESKRFHCIPLQSNSPEILLSTDTRPQMPELLKFPSTHGSINIPQKISTSFRTFGVFLLDDDTGSRVEALVHHHREDAVAINMAILREWLQGTGRQPVTWKTLVDVLRDSNLNTLANDITAGKRAATAL